MGTTIESDSEDTLSRQHEQLRNQGELFGPPIVPFPVAAKAAKDLYAWLTFGANRAGRLQHLCWAMPPADAGDWLAHINIIERASKTSSPPVAPTPSEEPAGKLKLQFREHIEESLANEAAPDKKKSE
jgi:hypothetical protein